MDENGLLQLWRHGHFGIERSWSLPGSSLSNYRQPAVRLRRAQRSHSSEVDYLIEVTTNSFGLPTPSPSDIDRRRRSLDCRRDRGWSLPSRLASAEAKCGLLPSARQQRANLGIQPEMLTRRNRTVQRRPHHRRDGDAQSRQITFSFALDRQSVRNGRSQPLTFNACLRSYQSARLIMQNDRTVAITPTNRFTGPGCSRIRRLSPYQRTGGQLQFVAGAYASNAANRSFACRPHMRSAACARVELFSPYPGNVVTGTPL